MKHIATWAAAIALALLLSYYGPIDDGAQVVADDKAEAISMARVAAKD